MVAKEYKSILTFGAGAASALLFLILSQGQFLGFLLGYFTPLPLLMVGLGLGIDAALWSSGAAIVLIFLATSALAAGALDAGITMGLSFIILFVLPLLMVAKRALMPGAVFDGEKDRDGIRKTPSNPGGNLQKKHDNQVIERIVSGLCLYVCCVLTLVWLSFINGPEGGLTASIETTIRDIIQKIAPTASERDIQPLLDMVPFLPSMFALSWFMILCINTVVAQSVLQRRGLNLRPTPILSHFQPPSGLMIVITGSTAILASGELSLLALNLTLILAIPYGLAGLAVAHWAVGHWHMNPLFLFVLYAILFFIPVLMVIVVFVGVIDRAVDIRGLRLPDHKNGSTHENKSNQENR